MQVGIIGLSPGNGHPFSFSAIVNGFCEKGFAASGWPQIHAYLKERSPDEFGFDGVRITHAWTQDKTMTARLCAASKIDRSVEAPGDMLGKVDAVIIARDDWRSHMPLARPFLDADVPVFVDKPLTLDPAELSYFQEFLESARLMSCSGLRFAREQPDPSGLGNLIAINGTVVMDWERYAVHLLDAVFATVAARPESICRLPAQHEAFAMTMDDGSVFTINAIGEGPKTFHIEYFGTAGRASVDMHDNFSAFRETLRRFFSMCRSGEPAIDPADTITAMRTVIAGQQAKEGGPHVRIADIALRDAV